MRTGRGPEAESKEYVKRRQCLGWSLHSCPRLQSPAGRSQTGSLSSLLFIHSPTQPGLRPPPRERARNTQRHHIKDKGKGGRRETKRLGEMKEEKKPKRKSQRACQISETNGRSANRQNGQRRWPGWAWRGRSEGQGGQSGGRPAREAGGTRRRFSGRPRPAVPAALRASFHTSPPPAPSVRSREYPLPPRPHLLLSCHPLASQRPPPPRGREEPL